MDKDFNEMNQGASNDTTNDSVNNTTENLNDTQTNFTYYDSNYNNSNYNNGDMNQGEVPKQEPNQTYYNSYNYEPFGDNNTGYRSSFRMEEQQEQPGNGKKEKGTTHKVLKLCGIIVLGLAVGVGSFVGLNLASGNNNAKQESSQTLAGNNDTAQNESGSNNTDNSEGALQEDSGNTNGSGASIGSTETVDSVDNTGVSAVVETALPSIVMINCNVTTTQYGQSVSGVASGSGIIIKEDDENLYIVTNYHVVEDTDSISIVFNDEESVDAKLKAYDSTNDLAVLKIALSDIKDTTKSSIKVATLGSSDDLKVGAMAIAIGNALGYGQSVTVGYVSALDRAVTIDETTRVLLQTDAAINPGNSGGALLDVNGKVIGINSAKYSSTEVEGVCYAIPISKAIPIINDLMTKETLSEEEKGYLGIMGTDVDETAHAYYNVPLGVLVSEVTSGGAADEAGIEAGDIITAVNGIEVTSISALKERVNSYKYGTEITLTVQKKNDGVYEEKEVKVTLQQGTSTDSSADSDSQSSGGSNSFGSGGSDDYYNYYGNQSGDGYSWPWSTN